MHKINVVTLGCSKNLVDSEVLMGYLHRNNYEVIRDSNSTDAKTVVINTCGFIQDAKQESIDMILGFVDAKKRGEIKNLFVMGCLSERYKDTLRVEIPEVDEFFGVNDLEDVLNKLNTKYKKELIGERHIIDNSHFAYVKISEGCDRTCSFCAIPLIRGKHKSRTIEEIVQETKYLVSRGIKEIILIAQDLTYYGVDIYKDQSLAKLLRILADVEGVEWIRLHYAYPVRFPYDILKVMRENDNICNYLDIPLQHVSSKILTKMRRGISKQQTYDLVKEIRNQIPGIAVRTTLLVGHPGETEKEFDELKEFVSEMKFDRLGVFTYSEEEDTFGARTLEDIIPQSEKDRRADEIMLLQQDISLENNNNKIGKTFKVLIDREEGDYYVGRTEYDSPEVDNEVLVDKSENSIKIGKFYNVNITNADSFDLYGEIKK